MEGPVPEKLEALVAPHIESFDYFIERGLPEAVLRVEGVEITHPGTQSRLRLWLENIQISKPELIGREVSAVGNARLFPSQCRESEMTYKGSATIEVCTEVDGGHAQRSVLNVGRLPIMVKSKLCHLRNLSQEALVKRREESNEMGGYFIVNGNERVIRLLILPRRNYVMALKRPSYANRGPGFSDKACTIRCTRPDQTSLTIRLYYMVDGNANVAFSLRKSEYFIPAAVILKSVMECTDREIYERVVAGMGEGGNSSLGSHFIPQRVELMLRELHRLELSTRTQCLSFIGSRFRVMLDIPPRRSDAWVGQKVLDDFIFVHLNNPADKYNLLILMLHKLYALVDGLASEDSADCLQHHEILTPGHLLTMFVKEKLQETLTKTKEQILKDIKDKPDQVSFADSRYIKKALDKGKVDVGARVESLLSTGNLNSASGLDLMQTTGFTVVAEKLNYFRYVSHFRSVHRGAFFAQLRTTAVRKLLPESWGFMCPVHTPDGTPCGLLNHLALPCVVTTDTDEVGREKDKWKINSAIAAKLGALGMISSIPAVSTPPPPISLTVMLDGRVIGSIPAINAVPAVGHLRLLKVTPGSGVPPDLEVGYVPPSAGGQYPGLYLFSTPARMMRPVRQLPNCAGTTAIELVGSFEQAYMEIRCPDGTEVQSSSGDAEGSVTGMGAAHTHEELSPTNMLSLIANLTPWSDYNQSPRNMYQCQMGKQTMGFPLHSFPYRADNKLYRLHTPQTPISRTKIYTDYNMDEYPTGTNAVVAVLSYTGYDMEDAMIINKSSMERGLCHGTIYKTETIDLAEKKRGVGVTNVFAHDKQAKNEGIDVDGLPYIGQRLKEDDGYCCQVNKVTRQSKVHKLHGSEHAVVDQVSLIGAAREPLQKVSIRMRYERKPVIGDKFSSRHGQKGVLSQLWPDVDMPFSDRHGIRPDIIINPHAFPSRMTIGMLIESMASKVGALKGEFVDCTPFQAAETPSTSHQEGDEFEEWDESKEGAKRRGGSMVDEFGKQLVAKGYSYHGTESMYSGLYGTEMDCHIYIGLVYYQRLRHMVSDKFQVRSVGPVNNLHRQPVKGRKAGGGIRFGEMERDALLAHGSAFLLHDRLHTCSDYHTMDVCGRCGSLLAPELVPSLAIDDRNQYDLQTSGVNRRRVVCRICEKDNTVERVAMPYVFKYLASELAAMNIKLELALKDS